VQPSNLSNILLVTNGAAVNNMGAFGWIIGTKTGTQLATGSGPVFGFDPWSYRAKTDGCLPGMTFVQLTFHLCQHPMHRILLSVCFDNQGLLKKQISFWKFALAKYSAALHSKWDILISIYNIMVTFPQLPELKHAYGHPDLNINFADLSLDA
jgi:hypothetical protein